MTTLDTIVIGAGQAGLAAGYHLRTAKRAFLILEAGPKPQGAWPRCYDSLRLFSPARYSSLPGLPFPSEPDGYPNRDQVSDYLGRYAEHFQLPLALNTEVTRVEREGGGFRVHTPKAVYAARSVIAASGTFGRPHRPEIPGAAGFAGRAIHAADYRAPSQFAGHRVVVVGAGNTAVQIGAELARVAHTTLATREPLHFQSQHVLGRDVHFWLRWTGLDIWPVLSAEPPKPIDSGHYREAYARNQPERRPVFTRFTERGVVWADGRIEDVDAVIFATGYRPNLPYLDGTGALDAGHMPLHRRGISTSVPGLYYVGLPMQRSLASATLRGVGRDAGFVVRRLGLHLDAAVPAPSTGAALRRRIRAATVCCS